MAHFTRINSSLRVCAIAAFSAWLASGCGGSSGGLAQGNARQACEVLAGKTIANAALTTTVVGASADVPEYCKVSGKIGTSLNFEMRLPNQWNGRLHYWGGGGYNGSIPPLTGPDANSRLPLVALESGFITVSSDSGHQGSSLDASFARSDTVAARMYGSLSVPTVMASAVKAVEAAYGRPPAKAYFEGCSNGGREALMAVQRNPKLFDGVIARAPGYNAVGFIGHFHLTAKDLAAPGGMLSEGKIKLIASRVRGACDALDGVSDGIVSNAAACTSELVGMETLRCDGGADRGDFCLSDAQMKVVTDWTSDVHWKGSPTFHNKGWSLSGNEDYPGVWDTWLTGMGNVRYSARYLLQDTTIRNYMESDPGVDSLAYSPYDQNPDRLVAAGAMNDATDADISPFLDNGGKLIFWHGGADPALSTRSTAEYYQHVRAAVGVDKADAATRLYFAPGVGHCAGGPGADTSDLLAALDAWSSQAVAPSTLVAVKRDGEGRQVFDRPLCAYPQYPRYVGPKGDALAANHAANYRCVVDQ